MKKFGIVLASFAMVLSMAACSSTSSSAPAAESSTVEEEAIYTAGTYTGTAAGFGGDVTVTVTVDATKITEVVVTGDGETPSVGGAALEGLQAAILEAQSADIEVTAGASVTSKAVIAAATAAIAEAKGEEVATAGVADGTYSTSATSYAWTGMTYADVTFSGGKITKIEITEEHDVETGEVSAPAYELLPGRIIENQSLATDSISGATISSNAIKSCVSQAIEAAGGNPQDWYTPVAKSTETVTIEGYDVIVVGMGGSGILSYCAAAANGATVFGIETTAKLGGQSATTTGPMVIDSKADVYADVTWAPADDVYKTWIDYVETEEKADIIKEAVYNSGAYLDYYIENFDFEFSGMILSFVKPEWSQFWTRYVGENGTKNIFGPNKTYQYNRAVEKALAYNEKNDYKLELTATELIMDADKTVKGVKAVAYDGTTYEVYGDSVILATGGYIGNEEMVAENLEYMPNTVAFTVNDGTGIQMGISAGGATYMLGVDPMIHILQVPNMVKNDDLTADQKAVLSAFALVSGEKSVTVVGEDVVFTGNDADIPEYHYYVVYTQEQMDSYKETGLTENLLKASSYFMGQGGTIPEGPIADLDTILEVGMAYKDVLKADSIADLAKQIGCDEATLSATLGGEETTYYAVICMSYAYGTVGGLDVDVHMNVLREDGTPIENLYCVGQDSEGVGNIEGKPYTPWGGQAQSWTFVSGYLAGTNAAANFAD